MAGVPIPIKTSDVLIELILRRFDEENDVDVDAIIARIDPNPVDIPLDSRVCFILADYDVFERLMTSPGGHRPPPLQQAANIVECQQSEDGRRQAFQRLLNHVANDPNWSSITWAFLVASELAAIAHERENPEQVYQIIRWTIEYFRDRSGIDEWIHQNGGWNNIEIEPEPSTKEPRVYPRGDPPPAQTEAEELAIYEEELLAEAVAASVALEPECAGGAEGAGSVQGAEGADGAGGGGKQKPSPQHPLTPPPPYRACDTGDDEDSDDLEEQRNIAALQEARRRRRTAPVTTAGDLNEDETGYDLDNWFRGTTPPDMYQPNRSIKNVPVYKTERSPAPDYSPPPAYSSPQHPLPGVLRIPKFPPVLPSSIAQPQLAIQPHSQNQPFPRFTVEPPLLPLNIPKSELRATTTVRPQSATGDTVLAQLPFLTYPQVQPTSGTTVQTQSPPRTTTRPESPSRCTGQPQSPTRTTTQPQSPTRTTTQPQSPTRTTTQPQSPTRTTTQSQSYNKTTTRPESPNRPTAQPQSPKRAVPGSPSRRCN